MQVNDIDITFVVQGDVRDTTVLLFKDIRDLYPSSKIVFSTVNIYDKSDILEHVDDYVEIPDPGKLPSYTKYDPARENNINRQIISSRAGISLVKTKYAVKIRSDMRITGTGLINVFQRVGDDSRLLVSTLFTRHPYGLNRYLYNVSDWLVFGRTELLLKLFTLDDVSLNDAVWFQNNSHRKFSSYSAKRFRSRFSPEQYLFIPYARGKGYKTPSFLNEFDSDLQKEYETFIGNELIVAEPLKLDIELKKYNSNNMSFYQQIDCVSFFDWENISGTNFNLYSPGERLKKKLISTVRCITGPIRYVIIYIAVKYLF